MRLYICGPMRNRPYYNANTFDRAKRTLRGKGHDPVSPADLDRAEGLDFSLYLYGTEPLPEGFDLPSLMRRDLAAIDTCDGLVLLPGWEHSTGAAVEIAYAKFLSLPIFMFEEFL